MRNRSLFGPFLLITVGVVWLLVSLNVIPSSNLWALVKFAPFALMGFGLALVVRSQWRVAGQILSGLVFAAAIAAVFFAPQLGWNQAVPRSFWGDFGGGAPGSGIIKSETRTPGEFIAVGIHYPAEVVIRQGSTSSVKIEADDNLLPQLTTEVHGDTLEIDSKLLNWEARVNPSKPVKITITVKELEEIDFSSAGKVAVEALEGNGLKVTLSGAGDITLSHLKLGSLEATLSGAGNIQADGSADEITVGISGLGSFKGADLASTKASITISGAGDATVRVKEDLSASITGAGSVRYYGSPSVEQNISGAGTVKAAE